MAVNQPPITGNEILDSWLLEVTRELNSGQRFEAFTQAATTPSTTTAPNIMINNYAMSLTDSRLYTFSEVDVDTHGPIRHRSIVFIGGLKLIESVDFNFQGDNQVMLLQSPDVDSNSMIELTVWSVT